jgi:hypothetical protein
MKKLFIALGVLVLFVGAASASVQTATPTTEIRGPNRPNELFYFEDQDSGAPGWYSVDQTVGAAPHFHVDTYFACDLAGHVGPEHYWCGEQNAAWAGGDGYANSWDDRLELPPVLVAAGNYQILTFKYSFDSEVGYDYTYVQAKQGGIYINLNNGYNGSSGGWNDLGVLGFQLVYDNPAECRFRFVSDGAWSDEDLQYDSDAGACHFDDIKIFDYYTGEVWFFDDVDSGPQCTPAVPGAAGDYWHIVTDLCSSFSDPNSWWCGDDADTSLIPPNLADALFSPVVSVAGAATCTLRMLIHAEVPTVDNDYWNNSVSLDGGTTFHSVGSWWGDFAGCDGWGTAGIAGDDCSAFLVDGNQFVYKLTFYTTDNGCGPGAAGGAGINLDDMWVEGAAGVPVEESSWGKVKAMYR